MLKVSISVFIFILITSLSIILYLHLAPVEIEDSENNSSKIKTQILGAIKNPGIYYIKPKKTLKDLIFLSGGLEQYANIKSLKLNEIVKPNSKHEVPIDESRITKKNINAISTWEELKRTVKTYLIKEKVAKSLVQYIKQFGKIQSWKEVDEIEGIGKKTLEELQKYFFIVL